MRKLAISTACKSGFINITGEIQRIVAESGMSEGACLIFIPHTSAGVALNEGADPTVQTDMLSRFDKISPIDPGYLHSEGNSHAHVKATLVGHSVTIPVTEGRLALGKWQSVYFCEFDGPRERQIYLQLLTSF